MGDEVSGGWVGGCHTLPRRTSLQGGGGRPARDAETRGGTRPEAQCAAGAEATRRPCTARRPRVAPRAGIPQTRGYLCLQRSSFPRPAKRNGQINAMFERAITFENLGPRVHSQPPHGPWVITFDNFISDEEAKSFITSTDHHFQRSLAGDQISPVRTSQQAWCQYGIAPDCVDHPLVHAVHDRVVNVTGIPKNNAEFFDAMKR